MFSPSFLDDMLSVSSMCDMLSLQKEAEGAASPDMLVLKREAERVAHAEQREGIRRRSGARGGVAHMPSL